MDRSSTATLIAQSYTQDEIGQNVPTESTTDVFCSIESIGQREWADAARQGFNPECRVTMNRWEYHNEQIVEIDGVRLSVYRTYVGRNETIELYLERQVGTELAEDS